MYYNLEYFDQQLILEECWETQLFQRKLQLFSARNGSKYPESCNFPELMPNVQFSSKPRLCKPRLDLLLGPKADEASALGLAAPPDYADRGGPRAQPGAPCRNRIRDSGDRRSDGGWPQ